jgi:hypothetical protein
MINNRISLWIPFFLFCSFIFNIQSGYCMFDDFFAKKNILKWNESNSEKIHFDINNTYNGKLLYKDKKYYVNVSPVSKGESHLDTMQREADLKAMEYYFCFFKGSIKNNTADILQMIILPIHILSDDKVVLTKNICLNITIFPTANISINKCFPLSYLSSGAMNNSDADELYRIKQQLGDKYGWRVGKPIIIPKLESLKSISKFNVGKRLGIEIDFYFNYDAEEQSSSLWEFK